MTALPSAAPSAHALTTAQFDAAPGCEWLFNVIWTEPHATYRGNFRWTPELVVWTIQKLDESGHSVSPEDLRQGREPGATDLIHLITGRDSTGLSLYMAGKKLFKSWDEALIASGLNPKEVGKLIRWTKQDIVEILQTLSTHGILLHSYNIRTTEAKIVSDVIFDRFRKRVDGSSLYFRAESLFGSWDKALEAAGFNPKDTRTQNQWKPSDILVAIRALDLNGLALNSAEMRRDSSLRTAAIILDAVGFFATGLALQSRAEYWFGSWDKALLAAGLDPAQIRLKAPTFDWSAEKIVKAIRIFNQLKIPLNQESIRWNSSPELVLALEREFGFRITGSMLIAAAKAYFGNWSKALQAAGFDPDQIRLIFNWTKPQIIESVLVLKQAKVPLSPGNLRIDHDGKVMRTLSLHHRRFIHGSMLYAVAVRQYGSWAKALRAAGLDPRDHFLNLPAELSFSHHPDSIVTEWGKEDGELRLHKYLIFGGLQRTPDEQLEQSQAIRTFDDILSRLTPDRKALAYTMLEAFETADFDGIDSLSLLISKKLNRVVQPKMIEELFSQLAREGSLEPVP